MSEPPLEAPVAGTNFNLSSTDGGTVLTGSLTTPSGSALYTTMGHNAISLLLQGHGLSNFDIASVIASRATDEAAAAAFITEFSAAARTLEATLLANQQPAQQLARQPCHGRGQQEVSS